MQMPGALSYRVGPPTRTFHTHELCLPTPYKRAIIDDWQIPIKHGEKATNGGYVTLTGTQQGDHARW